MKFYLFILVLCVHFFGFSQYKVPVYTVTSLQSAQPGEEAYYTIDDDVNTIYHSDWSINAIPDQLDFYFPSAVPPIHEIVYTPRQTGLNGIWTKVDVLYSTHTNPENFIVLYTDLEWALNNADKTISLDTPIENVAVVRFVINEGYEAYSSCAEMSFYSNEEYVDSNSECEISTENLPIDGANDVKIQIIASGTFASAEQAQDPITSSFDGDLNTMYHSPWSYTEFPVTLNYHFDGNSPMDYFKYYPRIDGGVNGNFGNVTISYNTLANPNFQTLLEYNFGELSMPQIVNFPSTIVPLNVQLTIHSGAYNYASCAEIEFYKKNEDPTNDVPTNIFANELCSALLPNVNQAQIIAIENQFYRELAQCLYDGNYNLHYRMQEYEVYKPYTQLEQELKTWSYNQYENPTGIAFDTGEKVAVFVGSIPSGASIFLKIKNHEDGYYGADSYNLLKEGLNVFEIDNTGLGYISYYNSDETLPNIPIHIVSGKVSGYFNLLTSDESEWIDLLMNTNYPKIDLVGEFTHNVFNKYALKAACPFDGKRLIQKYDTIVRYEWDLMGLFKYDIVPKNRMYGFIEAGNGYYAHILGIHLDETWGLHDVADPDRLGYWGIPHEYGHINQMYPDLNWVGTTEVTNNIFSVWVQYKMNNEGNKYTRQEDTNAPFLPYSENIVGGTINGTINSTYVYEQPLQDGLDNMGYDVFHILVPFWQLQLYYQQAGASKGAPLLTFDYPQDYTGVDYAHWYGTVCEIARNTQHTNWTHGQMVMNFVKNTCDAVQEDLTDFFINTGFLRPIDKEIDDYGIAHLIITQEMINETIDYVENKGYEKPVSPVINYLSAHSVESFRNLLPVSGVTGVGVTVQSEKLIITNNEWKNAVAFEVYTTDEELLHVAIVGTGDISLETSVIYYPSNADKVWAVGFDGEKILVYPEQSEPPLTITEFEINELELTIYPNPSYGDQDIHFKGEENWVEAGLYSHSGALIQQASGELNDVENIMNASLKKANAGMFTIVFKNKVGKRTVVKLIRL